MNVDLHRRIELKITWFIETSKATLSPMVRDAVKPGRPPGTATSDPVVAAAFGAAVRATRHQAELSQEELAHVAGVERAHLGKIERGEHMPTLAMAIKVARALGVSTAKLIAATEENLPEGYAP